jgi:type I restriction enzyme S subunit
VPEHWSIKQLKHCIHRLGAGGTPESGNPEYWADSESDDSIPWVAIGDMSSASVVCSTAKSLTQTGVKEKNLEIFPAGSLLYSIYASLGKVSILGVDAAFNQAILAIVPNLELVSLPFLRYWLESIEKHLSYYSSSNTQANLNAAKVLAYPVAVPHAYEQSRITSFLDHETAKIDALIAEQQRLIELLQEKRQTVISHAVTKGLNPDAPMKDSRVEWLGEVPEHWRVKQVRHLLRSLSQGSSPNCLPDPAQVDEYGVLKVGCVNGSAFLPGENKALPAESHPDLASLIQQGDVLMSRGNTRELVGLAALVTEASDRLMASDLIFILRVRTEDIDPGFLVWALRSGCTRTQLEPKTVGTSASMQKINQSTIKEIVLAIPPLAEQSLILEGIREEVQQTEESIGNTREAITLLQERRSALISAAVTGQIDVRGLVPETEAA